MKFLKNTVLAFPKTHFISKESEGDEWINLVNTKKERELKEIDDATKNKTKAFKLFFEAYKKLEGHQAQSFLGKILNKEAFGDFIEENDPDFKYTHFSHPRDRDIRLNQLNGARDELLEYFHKQILEKIDLRYKHSPSQRDKIKQFILNNYGPQQGNTEEKSD